MDGWIKIHYKFLQWEWANDANMVSLFIHLLLKANYKDKNWKGQMVKRGQLITGRKALEIETGISQQSIRTCLERLKSTNELTIKSTNKYSLITICNYEQYQTRSTNKSPTDQPSTNQQLTTPKEGKKVKKYIPPTCSEVISYFLENGYTEVAGRRAFEYYNVAEWVDSKGNKVKSWKQKMRGVWFKDENKHIERKNQVIN